MDKLYDYIDKLYELLYKIKIVKYPATYRTLYNQLVIEYEELIDL